MFSVCVRRDIHTPWHTYTSLYIYLYIYIYITFIYIYMYICMYMHMLKIACCLSIRCTTQSYLGCSTSRAMGSCLLYFTVSLSVSLYLTMSDYAYLNICTCILQAYLASFSSGAHIHNFKIWFHQFKLFFPCGFWQFSFWTIQWLAKWHPHGLPWPPHGLRKGLRSKNPWQWIHDNLKRDRCSWKWAEDSLKWTLDVMKQTASKSQMPGGDTTAIIRMRRLSKSKQTLHKVMCQVLTNLHAN